jgi:predicted DNA-binding transcriptional regulator AlpA
MEATLADIRDPKKFISRRVAAQLVGKSLRTFDSWLALGVVPARVQVSESCVVIDAAKLRQWISAGLPMNGKRKVYRSKGSRHYEVAAKAAM